MENQTERHAGLEILLMAEFDGAIDTWSEFLCIQRNDGGTITLSSRSRPILAEVSAYEDDDGKVTLPETIDGERVDGCEGGYVVGEELLLVDDEAEITLPAGSLGDAEAWLAGRGWDKNADYQTAWLGIATALSGRIN